MSQNNLKQTTSQSEVEFEKYLQTIEDLDYQGLVSQGLPENSTPSKELNTISVKTLFVIKG